ncbi:hypothetical protein PV326_011459 [Microctonus aethiopoides]|nr:hypothetical protein PV326_011459 [Microctonus aethiopoides]
MTVELKDLNDKFLGKHFVGDLKIPRRSLRHQPKETDGNSVEQLTMTDTNKTIEAVKLMQEVSSRPSIHQKRLHPQEEQPCDSNHNFANYSQQKEIYSEI